MDPILDRPILFAHRGGAAHAPENTIPAFTTALRLGATGIESDVWLTADGVPVLDHRGAVRRRKLAPAQPISALTRSELPDHVPSLADLYAACGTDYQLSLDVKDAAAAGPAVAVARDAGADDGLWLCHPDFEQVATWRDLSPAIKLVDSTRLRRIREGPERRAARLADAGIDAVNMHATDWTGGLTTLFHRFRRLTLGWDAQFERVVLSLLAIGIDGVYGDHVDRMVDAMQAHMR